MTMITRALRHGLLVAVFAAGLSACGGGGGGGGTNPPPAGGGGNDGGGGGTGGITRTGVAVAVGSISGFGSIIVNGIEYDTSSAIFTIDDNPGSQDDLSVGHVVAVRGTINDDNTNAVATSVDFGDLVEGPVSSVDTVNNTLVVLGQTVAISAVTSIDDNCPASLGDFLSVAAIEVSGLPKADGSIDATRIECKAVLGVMEVTGIVSGLTGTTFMINGLTVDYMSVPAVLSDFESGPISNGDPVEAKGTSINGSNQLVASSVEFKGNQVGGAAGDHIEIEGFISEFTSATDFDVSGFAVTTNASTVYEGGSASDLGMNIKVEVEGEIDSAGVLLATKVEIKRAKSVRIVALVDSVTGNSLVVLGITVDTDARTRFEDKIGGGARVDPLHISDINAGDYVEVRGQEFPANSGTVLATIVERDDARSESIIQGFVQSVANPTYQVLGVTIDTTGAVFKDEFDVVIGDPASNFWPRVQVGSLLKAKGIETSVQGVLAEEVEFEVE